MKKLTVQREAKFVKVKRFFERPISRQNVLVYAASSRIWKKGGQMSHGKRRRATKKLTSTR